MVEQPTEEQNVIQLSPGGRTYIDVNGNEYARVTDIISADDWSLQRMKAENPGVLQSAADFGTLVHKVCELHDLKQNDEVYQMLSNHPEIAPFYAAWVEWTDLMVKKWLAIEQKVYSLEYRAAGTVDRVGLLVGDKKPCIIDIKTSSTLTDKVGVQMAAYRLMYNQSVPKRKQAVRMLAFHMPRKGEGLTAKPKEYTTDATRYEKEFIEKVRVFWNMKG